MCLFMLRCKEPDKPVEADLKQTTFSERVRIGMDDDGAPYRVVNPVPRQDESDSRRKA